MTRIVVGFDGSPSSVHALDAALEEAGLRGAELEVVTVVPSGPYAPFYGYAPQLDFGVRLDQAERAARLALDGALGGLGERAPTRTGVQARIGIPAEELLAQAKDADLLVVGTRGAGGFTRMILGSVSTAVVHHAACPVLIVPAELESSGSGPAS